MKFKKQLLATENRDQPHGLLRVPKPLLEQGHAP
jgi:hypothetical protein